jgi:hypothetical protein
VSPATLGLGSGLGQVRVSTCPAPSSVTASGAVPPPDRVIAVTVAFVCSFPSAAAARVVSMGAQAPLTLARCGAMWLLALTVPSGLATMVA